MKIGKRIWLWYVMLAVGIVCTLILLAGRISAEREDKNVAAAFYLSDLEELAETGGHELSEWSAALSAAGVEYLILEEDDLASPEVRPELSLFSTVLAKETMSRSFVPAFQIPDEETPVADNGIPVILVENFARTAVTEPAGFDWDGFETPLVKTLWMFDDYRCRYTDELRGQEIENLLFRATAERGMRLLILRPFAYEDGTPVLDTAVYEEVLNGLSERLAVMGITFGNGFSAMDAPAFRPLLSCGSGLLAAALWIALLMKLPLPQKAEWLLCLMAIAVLTVCFLVLPDFALRATMLLTALIFPLWTAWALERFAAGRIAPPARIPLPVSYLIALAAVVVWSMLGGLSVAALMSRRIYLMGGAIFSGVKVSQFFPLVICAVLMVRHIRRTFTEGIFNRKNVVPLLISAAALGLMAWLLLLYSGDGNHLPGPEDAIRDWFELHLYARPRNKELFFAVPALGCFMLACRKKDPLLMLPLSVAACLESASVVNTFCHAVAPLSLSVVRTLLAAGLGGVLGLVCMAVLWFALGRPAAE